MPSKSKCRLCGGDVFNADISSGIITCVRCGQQYSMGAGKKEQPQPQPQRSTQTSPMTDTSSPNDFKIANGVLRKYTGNSKYVVIPEGVTEIAIPAQSSRNRAVQSVFNSSIEYVMLPKSLKKIGEEAFALTNIKRIEIPFDVTTIGPRSFYGCANLKNISLPDSLSEIGIQTFSGCQALHSIEIPSNVNIIRSCAFERCSSLSEIKLNNGLKKIELGAFSDCTSLESIVIPESVIEISTPSYYDIVGSVFHGCYMLTNITYPNRFSPDVFSGSAWCEAWGKQRRSIANGICPDCGGKLGMFNKCKRCGKKF